MDPDLMRPQLDAARFIAKDSGKSAINYMHKYYMQNEESINFFVKITSFLSYIAIIAKVFTLIYACVEYVLRARKLRRATSEHEVGKEVGRWRLAFGQSGVFDIVNSLIVSLFVSFSMKLGFAYFKQRHMESVNKLVNPILANA